MAFLRLCFACGASVALADSILRHLHPVGLLSRLLSPFVARFFEALETLSGRQLSSRDLGGPALMSIWLLFLQGGTHVTC